MQKENPYQPPVAASNEIPPLEPPLFPSSIGGVFGTVDQETGNRWLQECKPFQASVMPTHQPPPKQNAKSGLLLVFIVSLLFVGAMIAGKSSSTPRAAFSPTSATAFVVVVVAVPLLLIFGLIVISRRFTSKLDRFDPPLFGDIVLKFSPRYFTLQKSLRDGQAAELNIPWVATQGCQSAEAWVLRAGFCHPILIAKDWIASSTDRDLFDSFLQSLTDYQAQPHVALELRRMDLTSHLPERPPESIAFKMNIRMERFVRHRAIPELIEHLPEIKKASRLRFNLWIILSKPWFWHGATAILVSLMLLLMIGLSGTSTLANGSKFGAVGILVFLSLMTHVVARARNAEQLLHGSIDLEKLRIRNGQVETVLQLEDYPHREVLTLHPTAGEREPTRVLVIANRSGSKTFTLDQTAFNSVDEFEKACDQLVKPSVENIRHQTTLA